jgi:hypothetical protein
VEELIDGQSYWLPPDAGLPAATSPDLHLLPGFDEYLLGYKNRDAVLDPSLAPEITPYKNGIFQPIIVVDGRVVGTWKRTLNKSRVEITAMPFMDLGKAAREAIGGAAAHYGEYLGLPVDLA